MAKKRSYDKSLKKAVDLSLGLLALAREKAEKKVKELSKRGDLNKKDAEKILTKITKDISKEQNKVLKTVHKELKRAINIVGGEITVKAKRFKKSKSKNKKRKKK